MSLSSEMHDPALESYQSNYGEVSMARRWIIVALLFSLAIHGALIVIFNLTHLERFTVTTERLVPRAFTVNRVEIDPRVLNDAEPEKEVKQENRPPIPVNIPDEKPSVPTLPQDVRITPIAPDLAKAIVSEKPKADAANLQTMAKLQKSASQEMDKELESYSQKLIKEAPSKLRPSINVSDVDKTGSAGADAETSGVSAKALPGLASLDEALSGGGKYDPSKPIGIPGGALFEYDSADLKQASISSMQKLNKLLTERFPQAIFSIEGHTDSFGKPEYNQALSQRRAEAVKTWLVQNCGIPPERLQTVGYGSSHLIVPASGTVEQQAPNRRVEISIHTQ